ncbi:helix-turn-helix transcriptional regulator [Actinomadura rayongensis]|uniref:WYL domain-containing protein n=1 Tax=Actinomadura rayongensis TaxID=1429076 RepID=A0A6I4WAJ5_9ACTN|nr:WYL domain-containing protein [Actinomadura rayongensis]MXQ65770.1 WYL domain-containing protein [Actinomadura rayongensis]
MLETSARLLRLLSLLQSRADWTGAELAERLGVGIRTLRRDVERLRGLGYPVEATPGALGGYRLGIGANLPPLLLDDEEAVAVVISLRTAATGTVAGMEEAALRALAKVQQVLPSRIRHRVTALQTMTVSLASAADTGVSADLLAALATACRDHRRIRVRYRTSSRELEPYRLVHTSRRWYLLAWDLGRDDWRTFRADRIEPPLGPPGARFAPRPLPDGDPAAYISHSISAAPYRYQARVLFHAPLERMAPRTSPAAGRLEAVDDRTCVFHTGSNSLEELALYVAVKGVDFEILDPPELIPVLHEIADRLHRAATPRPRP